MAGVVRKLLSSRPVAVAFTALAVGGALLLARGTGGLMTFELTAYDSMRNLAAAAPDEERLLLVAIREDEIRRFGHPLPDATLAAVIRQLAEAAPRAIGVDLYRTAPNPPGGSGWSELEQIVLAHRTTVLVELGGSEAEAIGPPPFLERGDQVGLSDVLLDPDGIVRRLSLIQWDDAGAGFSFALQLARHYLASEGVGLGPGPDDPETLMLGAALLPPLEADDGGYRGVDAGGYQILFDYGRGPSHFDQVSLSELVDGRVPPAAIRDRVVIIGSDTHSVKDEFLTPYARETGDKGFAVHAHAVEQLIRLALGESPAVGVASEWSAVAWIAFWCLLGAALPLAYRSVAIALSAMAAGTAIVAGASTAALVGFDLWLPPVAPALGWLLASMVATTWVSQQSRRERAIVMDLFGRYASSQVAEQLWERRDEFLEGGRPRPQRQSISALLSDLKGYTAASEKMDPYDLMAWINEYMDAMTRVIEAHGGHVDDYVGDGIKANFGVPLPSTSEAHVAADARAAVRCGLAMGDALEALNREWRTSGRPTGRMRIGIFTGPAVVGSIGSQTRLKYTSVGDTVNTAARLEAFDKDDFDDEGEAGLCRILVSDSTHSRLGPEFLTEPYGAHPLRGKDRPIEIFRVVGMRSNRDG